MTWVCAMAVSFVSSTGNVQRGLERHRRSRIKIKPVIRSNPANGTSHRNCSTIPSSAYIFHQFGILSQICIMLESIPGLGIDIGYKLRVDFIRKG